MSLRVIFCFLYVIGFSAYAWRNWFVSACAAIFLMAFFQHPDMPKSLGGIQGLNPWNILVANVTFAWLAQRARKGCVWDMPKFARWAFALFAGTVIWSFTRLARDPANLEDYSLLSAFSEYVINNLKWLLMAIIIFDSARSRREVLFGLITVIGLYLFLALQVIKWVPLSFAASGDEEFSRIAYKLIHNEIGYNRVTMSMILGGASWATLAFLPFVTSRSKQLGILGVSFIITLGQALTGGRTGYISWALVGFIFCVVRWRKLLLLVPVVIIAAATFLPGVRDRVLFGTKDNDDDPGKMTSGRTTIWPHVVEYIGDAPVFGYGRLGMQRTGLTRWVFEMLGEDNFGHPHNAYLEQLLDNGIIGFLFVLPMYFIMLWLSFRLFLDKVDPLYSLTGGIAAAMILALLIGAMGGQTFYPRESSAGMWAAIGLMLRVYVEARNQRETGEPPFGEQPEESEETLALEENATPDDAPESTESTT